MLKGLSEPEELYEIRIPALGRDHAEPRAQRVSASTTLSG